MVPAEDLSYIISQVIYTSMARMASQLAELFSQLSLSGDKMTILSQIRTLMASASNEDLFSVVSQLPLTGILQNIDADDGDQLESCCVILDRLFSAVDVKVLLTTFNAELLLGLSHNSPAVNEIGLNQVARVANAIPQQLASYVEVVQRISLLIGRETVSNKAVKIFVTLGGNSEGLELIFHNQVLPHLVQVMSKDDSTRFRVYEMVVDISLLSVEAMLRCSESALLQLLITELNKDDVVIQLNCLELLSKFSLCEHGFAYMEQTQAVRRIEDLLVASQDNAGSITSMLIIPGLFKFFGGLCFMRPKAMCARFQLFMKAMFAMMDPDAEDADPANADVAMDTIGLIGSTPDGKMALAKHYDAMLLTCRSLGRLLTGASSNRRSRALSVVGQLMHLEVVSQTVELLQLTKDWFDHLSDSDPLKKILAVAKQPFAELHIPGLGVIESLAGLPWGQEYLSGQPGFEEYLIDRRTETTKEGMERKFAIVRTLVDSPTASSVFGNESFLRLRTFVSQGPFYVQTQTLVAFDSA